MLSGGTNRYHPGWFALDRSAGPPATGRGYIRRNCDHSHPLYSVLLSLIGRMSATTSRLDVQCSRTINLPRSIPLHVSEITIDKECEPKLVLHKDSANVPYSEGPVYRKCAE